MNKVFSTIHVLSLLCATMLERLGLSQMTLREKQTVYSFWGVFMTTKTSMMSLSTEETSPILLYSPV